jgi:hypothetical protein
MAVICIFPTSGIFPSGRTISYVRIPTLCLAKPSNIRPEKPRASISRSVTPTGFLEPGEAKQLGKQAGPSASSGNPLEE